MTLGVDGPHRESGHNRGVRTCLTPWGRSAMKRLVLSLALTSFVFLNLSTNAQNNEISSDDYSAVRATVTNYIEAYYAGDARRMEQTLHPHYLKHMIHGSVPVREKTGAERVHEVRSNGAVDSPQSERTAQ